MVGGTEREALRGSDRFGLLAIFDGVCYNSFKFSKGAIFLCPCF